MPRYDDDDDRPRRRRRDEDEDDRPRRRSRDDDEDDERPRSRRKSRRDYDDDYEDRPRRKSRPKAKELNAVGLAGLIIAIPSLFVSFIPCMGWYAIIPALVGMVVGLTGLWMSQRSDGRQSPGLPFAAMGVSALAILIALGWLLLFKGVEREINKMGAEHRADIQKAAFEVKAASNPIRITAEALANEYEQDTDNRYEGKVLEVTGTVKKVDFDELEDEYRVELRTGTDTAVYCDFIKSPEIQARLKQLKPGDRVTIRGKYIILGDAVLEGCLLVN